MKHSLLERVRSHAGCVSPNTLGRSVTELLPAGTSGEATWKPAGDLPAGVYTVRATTTERTVSTKVTRK